MTNHRRVGSRAPLTGLTAAVLALLLFPTFAIGADWTAPDRVSNTGGARLDSLHQLAASRDVMHLVYPRIGPGKTDDRVIYRRSSSNGMNWSRERALFKATSRYRKVVPNLAIAARGNIVVVAFRASGPKGHSLFVRVSRNGGRTFSKRVEVFSTSKSQGIGVPAVAVGNDFVAVAWTNRAKGQVRIRSSRDEGRTFRGARVVGTTKLSIDCRTRVTDGLVGLAANDKSIHVAWSAAPKRQCYASAIRVRTSLDRGQAWSPARTITERDSFGWPELDARGKTVVATVQATGGGLIVARSAKNGRNWRESVLKPSPGHSLSAADVALLPRGKAMITYVKERLRNGKLVGTRLVSRRSPDDGTSWNTAKAVTTDAKLLRMAPNVVAVGGRVALVVQSGQLDGKPRHIYASRLR
jgi:hypothetical protein